MLNIIVFGAPCSGKGTQSKKLADLFNLIHISTGEIFRKEIKSQTSTGKFVQSYINAGELVPDDIVLKELFNRNIKNKNNQGFVFDGFPRTLNQALIFEKSLKNRKLSISGVIYIDVEECELISRLNRRCKSSDRSDDSLEILKNRIKIYQKETLPLLEYYKKEDKLAKISGMAPIEEVFGNIKHAINAILKVK